MSQIWAISRPSSSATNAARVTARGPPVTPGPRGVHIAGRAGRGRNAWLWETTRQRYELDAHSSAR